MIEQIQQIKQQIKEDKKIAFISGNFNILHAGHQRLLKFAKDNCDYLVVAVNKTDPNVVLIDENLRLEGILNSIFVDYAFVIENYLDCIKLLKPNIVVKGKEHELKYNPEEEIINKYGGKLIFTSGTIGFSSLELLKNEFLNSEIKSIQKPLDYLTRKNIKNNHLKKTIRDFDNLNIAVIGDTIIDEYIICDPIGMSQEDPTIVVNPISKKLFIGGAAIVSAHAAGLGAKVDFYSVLGEDETANFLLNEIKRYNVNTICLNDPTRPTTLKQRFRANDKTLLRVNTLKNHAISKNLENKILEMFNNNKHKYDLIVFSDFSYGCLTKTLINSIINIANKKNIKIAADSQSSSQTGDITKFHNINLLTPTEREARLGINDFESGLIILSEKIQKQINCENLIITLGKEGLLVFAGRDTNGNILIDKIPALNNTSKDVSGAGDSLLISTAMSLCLGNSIWESSYIGSLCAAIQVGRVGNIPLTKEELLLEIEE